MRLRHSFKSGYTLIEVVIALPLMTVLVMGAASAIGIATLSQPDSASPTVQMIRVGAMFEQLASELTFASQITIATSKQITFTAPDRDGNGTTEVCSYAWSGVVGDPLTRVVNGSPAEMVLNSVQACAWSYDSQVSVPLGVSYIRAVTLRLTTTTAGANELSTTVRLQNEPLSP